MYDLGVAILIMIGLKFSVGINGFLVYLGYC
jgi:hypothetical protein